MQGGKEMDLPKSAENILRRYKENGFSAYAVGGFVRDSLMGRECADIDIATSAFPEDTKRIFHDVKIIPTGEKHGTLTLVADNRSVEVTTFRIESEYSDSRHPDSVCFTESIRDDLSRRDFTVNAMALGISGEIVDPFGGKRDIELRLIRCVGDAEERFREDPLRILRALRFCSVLGFEPEKTTLEAALKTKDMLSKVSRERIFAELVKLLCGEYAGKVIEEHWEIISEVIPEISACHGFLQNTPYHIYDVLVHTAKAVDGVPREPILRLAAFFHDIGKPLCYSEDENGVGHFHSHSKQSARIAQERLTALKAPSKTVCEVTELCRYHDYLVEPNEPQVLRALNKFGELTFRRLLAIKRGDENAKSSICKCRIEMLGNVETVLDCLIKRRECFSLKQLKIDGNDLVAMGIPEGKEIGAILNTLLSEVMEKRIENDKDVLLKRGAEIFGQKPQ